MSRGPAGTGTPRVPTPSFSPRTGGSSGSGSEGSTSRARASTTWGRSPACRRRAGCSLSRTARSPTAYWSGICRFPSSSRARSATPRSVACSPCAGSTRISTSPSTWTARCTNRPAPSATSTPPWPPSSGSSPTASGSRPVSPAPSPTTSRPPAGASPAVSPASGGQGRLPGLGGRGRRAGSVGPEVRVRPGGLELPRVRGAPGRRRGHRPSGSLPAGTRLTRPRGRPAEIARRQQDHPRPPRTASRYGADARHAVAPASLFY